MLLIFQAISNKPYGLEVDWWSFGVIIYILLHGELPFSPKPESTYLDEIQEGKISFHTGRKIKKDLIKKVCNESLELYKIYSLNLVSFEICCY